MYKISIYVHGSEGTVCFINLAGNSELDLLFWYYSITQHTHARSLTAVILLCIARGTVKSLRNCSCSGKKGVSSADGFLEQGLVIAPLDMLNRNSLIHLDSGAGR